VAKRKTLFDDRPIEISELTYIIRQDIASLNTQIGSLQSYVRTQKAGGAKGGGGAVEEHNSNVVMLLQSRLANMGMGFKDVLELRTQVGRTFAAAVSPVLMSAEHESQQRQDRAVYAHHRDLVCSAAGQG
jgi:syntaxin 5